MSQHTRPQLEQMMVNLLTAAQNYTGRAMVTFNAAADCLSANQFEQAGDHLAAATCLMGSSATVMRDLATIKRMLEALTLEERGQAPKPVEAKPAEPTLQLPVNTENKTLN